MYAIISDFIKDYTIEFKAHLLAAKREKYGDRMRVLDDDYVKQQAAPTRKTVVAWMDQKPAVKAKPIKKEKPEKLQPIQKIKAIKAPKKERKIQDNAQFRKPIICTVTGKYFESQRQASQLIPCCYTTISEQIRGVKKQGKVRRSVKGHVFRFATPKEIEIYNSLPSNLRHK